jgi:hypothetical protein
MLTEQASTVSRAPAPGNAFPRKKAKLRTLLVSNERLSFGFLGYSF